MLGFLELKLSILYALCKCHFTILSTSICQMNAALHIGEILNIPSLNIDFFFLLYQGLYHICTLLKTKLYTYTMVMQKCTAKHQIHRKLLMYMGKMVLYSPKMVKLHFWPNAVEQEERWEKVFLSIYRGGKNHLA